MKSKLDKSALLILLIPSALVAVGDFVNVSWPHYDGLIWPQSCSAALSVAVITREV
jgi:hypothetical protein